MSDLEQHKKRRLDDDNGDDHRNSTSPVKHRESASDLVREKEAIARLLEPFSREQLLAILASAYVTHVAGKEVGVAVRVRRVGVDGTRAVCCCFMGASALLDCCLLVASLACEWMGGWLVA